MGGSRGGGKRAGGSRGGVGWSGQSRKTVFWTGSHRFSRLANKFSIPSGRAGFSCSTSTHSSDHGSCPESGPESVHFRLVRTFFWLAGSWWFGPELVQFQTPMLASQTRWDFQKITKIPFALGLCILQIFPDFWCKKISKKIFTLFFKNFFRAFFFLFFARKKIKKNIPYYVGGIFFFLSFSQGRIDFLSRKIFLLKIFLRKFFRDFFTAAYLEISG